MMINGDPFVNQILAGCTAHIVPWMHWCFFSTYQTAKICRTAQSFFSFCYSLLFIGWPWASPWISSWKALCALCEHKAFHNSDSICSPGNVF